MFQRLQVLTPILIFVKACNFASISAVQRFITICLFNQVLHFSPRAHSSATDRYTAGLYFRFFNAVRLSTDLANTVSPSLVVRSIEVH
jgi:hypothetical protein